MLRRASWPLSINRRSCSSCLGCCCNVLWVIPWLVIFLRVVLRVLRPSLLPFTLWRRVYTIFGPSFRVILFCLLLRRPCHIAGAGNVPFHLLWFWDKVWSVITLRVIGFVTLRAIGPVFLRGIRSVVLLWLWLIAATATWFFLFIILLQVFKGYLPYVIYKANVNLNAAFFRFLFYFNRLQFFSFLPQLIQFYNLLYPLNTHWVLLIII